MKPLESALSPDERFAIFMAPDPDGGFRSSTFEDHYALVALAALPPGAGELVARLYARAQNCFLYAWFDYEMMLLAQGQAFAALEVALKERLARLPEREGLRAFLKAAVSEELISPPSGNPRGAPDDWPSLHDMLVNLRNDIMHGSSQVHDPNMTYIVFDHIRALICEIHGLALPAAPAAAFGPSITFNGEDPVFGPAP